MKETSWVSYAKPDLRNVRPPKEPAKSEPTTLDLESLVEQLQKSPELAGALAALIAAQAPPFAFRKGEWTR